MALAVHFRAAVALAGRFPALSGVDLDVAAGEVVVLSGPNGAGKTSLLRACAGLLPVTSGTAEVLGHDLRQDPARVRAFVGVVGHAPTFYDELSATENLRFALKASKVDPSRVAPALARVGLNGRLATSPVGRLSTGQRRRVSLALLLARPAHLWLMDEPHAGLDAGARLLLAELVNEASGLGISIICASHESELATPLADRVVAMGGGRVTDSQPGGRDRTVLGGEDTMRIGARRVP